MIKIIRLMLVMMVIGLITGCVPLPRIYLGADEVHGTVVDAETKEPLQDVNVLAIWEQYDGYYGSHSANLVMRESVTDEKGYYKLDGWWPRFTMAGHLEDSMPFITFYKLGYVPKGVHNDRIYPPTKYSESIWNGRNIELEKFKGSKHEYAMSASFMDYSFTYDSRYAICDWKRVPVFTMAMIKLNEYLEKEFIWGPSEFTMNNIRSSAGSCGLNQGDVDIILRSGNREK